MCDATSWMPDAPFPSSRNGRLQWKERIGTLYHLNRLRLEQWDPERALTEQSAAFNHYHEALQTELQCMHEEATRMVASDRRWRQQ